MVGQAKVEVPQQTKKVIEDSRALLAQYLAGSEVIVEGVPAWQEREEQVKLDDFRRNKAIKEQEQAQVQH